MQRISARKEVRKHVDRPEILVARRTIDNVLGAENKLYEHF